VQDNTRSLIASGCESCAWHSVPTGPTANARNWRFIQAPRKHPRRVGNARQAALLKCEVLNCVRSRYASEQRLGPHNQGRSQQPCRSTLTIPCRGLLQRCRRQSAAAATGVAYHGEISGSVNDAITPNGKALNTPFGSECRTTHSAACDPKKSRRTVTGAGGHKFYLDLRVVTKFGIEQPIDTADTGAKAPVARRPGNA